jgi:hypothetical protein
VGTDQVCANYKIGATDKVCYKEIEIKDCFLSLHILSFHFQILLAMIIQKQLLLCCFFLLCSLYAAIAQRKIALEHSGASSFFTDIPTAIDAAVSGDIIYLPGGSFPGFDIFNKQLTIIGVGHNLDSTAATTMTLISGNIVMVGVDCIYRASSN